MHGAFTVILNSCGIAVDSTTQGGRRRTRAYVPCHCIEKACNGALIPADTRDRHIANDARQAGIRARQATQQRSAASSIAGTSRQVPLEARPAAHPPSVSHAPSSASTSSYAVPFPHDALPVLAAIAPSAATPRASIESPYTNFWLASGINAPAPEPATSHATTPPVPSQTGSGDFGFQATEPSTSGSLLAVALTASEHLCHDREASQPRGELTEEVRTLGIFCSVRYLPVTLVYSAPFITSANAFSKGKDTTGRSFFGK